MHAIVLDIALFWLLGLAGTCIALIFASRAAVVRLVLVDALTLLAVAALIVASAADGTPHFAIAAIALGVLSFVVTLAGARFAGWGRMLD